MAKAKSKLTNHVPGFKTQIEVSADLIRGLLCTAFEGGSNYWYEIIDQKYPPGTKRADFSEGGRLQDPKEYWHWCQLIPTFEGGALIITSTEGDEINGAKQWTLDRDAITRGLAVMSEKYPKHYGDAIGETGDAITGDVFLQCCLFGDIIYG